MVWSRCFAGGGLSWIRLGLEWQALGFTALSAVLVLAKKITAKWSRQSIAPR